MTGSFQPAGFGWAGLLCLVLAVLKLTGEAHWSWWRVWLPFWVVLGHNILYVAIGFIWLSLADDGAAEEAATIRKGHVGYGYQVAALVCFVVFADNVLKRLEGQPETMFLWVSSGRWETIVVLGMLSVIMQLLFWSEIVDPDNRRIRGGQWLPGIESIFQRARRVFDEFLDRTSSRALFSLQGINGRFFLSNTKTAIQNLRLRRHIGILQSNQCPYGPGYARLGRRISPRGCSSTGLLLLTARCDVCTADAV